MKISKLQIYKKEPNGSFFNKWNFRVENELSIYDFLSQKTFLQKSIENLFFIIIEDIVIFLLQFLVFMNYEMEFQGIVIEMWQEETVWQNNTRKITLVLEEESDNQYKQSLVLEQLWDRKVDMAKALSKWDRVRATLDCRAREYNGRWFNSLSAWRLEKMDWSSSSTSSSSEQADDLPF